MKLIKIPFIYSKENSGCELTPTKITENLNNTLLNENGILPMFDIETIEVNKADIEINFNNIFNKINNVIRESEKSIILGGDNSVTYPCFKALSTNFDDSGLALFDAHNHCLDIINNGFVKELIDKNILKKENIVIIGLRSWHKNEFKFIKQNKIKFFSADEIIKEGIHEVAESVMTIARNFNALYVSVDIDVLDPAFAPASNNNEPGGISSRELLFFLNRLNNLRNIKLIDLVNINTCKDIDNKTIKLGTKIISEFA
jgi:agmatinase